MEKAAGADEMFIAPGPGTILWTSSDIQRLSFQCDDVPYPTQVQFQGQELRPTSIIVLYNGGLKYKRRPEDRASPKILLSPNCMFNVRCMSRKVYDDRKINNHEIL